MDKFHPLISLNLVFILALTACDPSMIFEESQNLKGASWNMDSKLTFQVNITDTSEIANLYITTRNLGSYQNSNLFLFITTTSPTGATIRDTLDIVLADNNGKWKGKGIGDMHYLKTPWRTRVRFPYTGVYFFDITQGMREKDMDGKELKGIEDVGVRIEKVKQ